MKKLLLIITFITLSICGCNKSQELPNESIIATEDSNVVDETPFSWEKIAPNLEDGQFYVMKGTELEKIYRGNGTFEVSSTVSEPSNDRMA